MLNRPRRETKAPKALVEESPPPKPPRTKTPAKPKTPVQSIAAAAKRVTGTKAKAAPPQKDAEVAEAAPVAKKVSTVAAALVAAAAAVSPVKKKTKGAPLAAPARASGLTDRDVNLYAWRAFHNHDMTTSEIAAALGDGRTRQSIKDRLQRMGNAKATEAELVEKVALDDVREAEAAVHAVNPVAAQSIGAELLRVMSMAAPAPAPAKPPKKAAKLMPYYINVMGGPQAPAETEKDLGAKPMSKSRKVKLVHQVIDLIGDGIDADCRRWEQTRDVTKPPAITNYGQGCEEGQHKGKVHLQATFEFWDKEGLADQTVRGHLKDKLEPILKGLINLDDFETWPLSCKHHPKGVGVRAKGGRMYQFVYTHKDLGLDHGKARRGGLDAEGCAALGLECCFSTQETWDDAVAVYSKYASNSKGAAGKKEWKNLAAIVQGRSHAAVQILDKTNAVALMIKFCIAHDILWCELDPVTSAILMLSTGAYGLGLGWIASAHGGRLDQLRFASFMRMMTNGMLAACSFLISQALFGTNSDDESVRVFALNRSPLLPSLQQLRRMTLDEIKGLRGSHMAVPRRLAYVEDYSLKPHAPSCLIIDMGCALEPVMVKPEDSSFEAAAHLHRHGCNVNPIIIPAFSLGGDDDGSYAAAYTHALLTHANNSGLLTFAEPDCYHLFSNGTKTLAAIHTEGREFASVPERMEALVEAHLAAAPIEGLDYEISYDCGVENLYDNYAHQLALPSATATLFVHIIEVAYELKADFVDAATRRAAAQDLASVPEADDEEDEEEFELEPLMPFPMPEGLTDAAETEGAAAEAEGAAADGTEGAAGALPAADGATPTEGAAGALPGSTTGKRQTHRYVVAFWVGHEQHVFRSTVDSSFGSLPTEALWTAFRAAPSVEEAKAILLEHAPHEFFGRGTELLKNKSLQLALQRPDSLHEARSLDSYLLKPFKMMDVFAVLLCGAANIGKTAFARAHAKRAFMIKTLDQLQNVPGDCDLLIFDDMRFDADGLDLTPEQMLVLLDVRERGAIKCRHYDGFVPCIPRIFTTNLDPTALRPLSPFPMGANDEQQRALNRRYYPTPYYRTALYKKPPDGGPSEAQLIVAQRETLLAEMAEEYATLTD